MGGDRPSFFITDGICSNFAFSFSVWSNYFNAKDHEISAALLSCPSRPVAPGCFISASGRKKVQGVPKCHLSCLAEISRDWPVI